MLELGSGALIAESASGSLSGFAGSLGQMPGPAVGVGLEVDGVNGEKSCEAEGISGVGAGITESGKTALTAEFCFNAVSCAELTDATTNGTARPEATCVAPCRRSFWASGATSALTSVDRVFDRAARPAGLSRRRTMTFFIDPAANGIPCVFGL